MSLRSMLLKREVTWMWAVSVAAARGKVLSSTCAFCCKVLQGIHLWDRMCDIRCLSASEQNNRLCAKLLRI